MSTVYFNEFDKFAAKWLRNLYPDAHVDERDIRDVKAEDVAGFERVHFFGGIGGWQLALDIAGWSGWPVWTGSCPCQPFSAAGQRQGEADERHLWPELLRLISKCLPATIFGEQVASQLGREWLAGVRDDLEALGYEVGSADLCAACVGAPHRRQRLYWVANASIATSKRNARKIPGEKAGKRGANWGQHGDSVERLTDGCAVHASRLADTESTRRGMVNSENKRAPSGEVNAPTNTDVSGAERLGYTKGERFKEQRSEYRPSGERCSGLVGFAVQAGVPEWNGPTIAVECSDGYRRVSAQPEAFPLAHGVSRRVGKLRGAGNAIVPQLAAVFIRSFMEANH